MTSLHTTCGGLLLRVADRRLFRRSRQTKPDSGDYPYSELVLVGAGMALWEFAYTEGVWAEITFRHLIDREQHSKVAASSRSRYREPSPR